MESNGPELLDLRGILAPMALLKFTKVFREMEPNKTIEVLVGDKETKEELILVLESFTHQLIETRDGTDEFRIIVKKGSAGPEDMSDQLS